MWIGSHKIGGGIFFIVEEGMANLGSVAKAFRMVDAASGTGADGIEFQLLRAEDFAVRRHSRYGLYRSLELSDSDIADLVRYTLSKGLHFIATALTASLVNLLATAGCSAFNVNASDLTNPDVLDAVAATGKPFFLSLLLAHDDEIEWAVRRVAASGASDFALLHGQHVMFGEPEGVSVENTSLGFIETLRQRYHRPAGFIDHTPHYWMPAAAVCAGADVVTKHLAISRAGQGPDWQICLEPAEMSAAISIARKARRSVLSGTRMLAPGEEDDRLVMRKSVVAARPLSRGHVLHQGDLAYKRPGTGLSPMLSGQLIGKRLTREIASDDAITLADVGVTQP